MKEHVRKRYHKTFQKSVSLFFHVINARRTLAQAPKRPTPRTETLLLTRANWRSASEELMLT